MSRPAGGHDGSGSTLVYTLAQAEADTLETLAFTVTTDATAGTHAIRVRLVLPTVGTVARLDDLNAGGPSQTNFYTYGLGLNASTCTLPDGIAVTDALPRTELRPGAEIWIDPINAAGASIAGDQISAVLLQFAGAAQEAPVELPAPPLTLLPGLLAA